MLFSAENELINRPLSLANGRVQVTQQGQNFTVQTDFGLKVFYVVVVEPSTYQPNMCGLCGNNNNHSFPTAKNTNNLNEFRKSWALDQHPEKCAQYVHRLRQACTKKRPPVA